MILLIGSFTTNITAWTFDPQSKSVSYLSTVTTSGDSPTWLSLSDSKSFLFSTNETISDAGNGAVSLFTLDISNGVPQITFVNRVSTLGGYPTHLALGDRVVYASNYNSGSFAVIPIDSSDGTAVLQSAIFGASHGSIGPNPHCHQIVQTSTTSIAVVDLGIDQIRQYNVDEVLGVVQDQNPFNIVQFQQGYGPRHLALHPTEPLAFILCELASVVTALRFDRATGVLSPISGSGHEYVSTLVNSDGSSFTNTSEMGAAEIVISENGKFVYVSNRDISATLPVDPQGERSSIVVFGIDDFVTGKLRHVQTVGSGGRHPRHFTLVETATSSTLLVANKDSHNLVAFDVNTSTGLIDESTKVITFHDAILDPSFVLAI